MPSPSFAAFHRRARSGVPVRVVFLGGSLTWGAQATDPMQTSYRALVAERLRRFYPGGSIRAWDASIGGTGSRLAVFRLDRDVLGRAPDLVFLDFTVNDDPHTEPDPGRLASYEAVVRRLIGAGVPVVQLILPTKKDVLPEPPPRPLDAAHRQIGRAYGLPLADAVALARDRVAAGQTTPGALWDVAEDDIHPGDAGYALYAEAAWEAFEQAAVHGALCAAPVAPLHGSAYLSAIRRPLAALSVLPSGWTTALPNRSALAFDFTPSRWLDRLVLAQPGARPLALSFRGSEIFHFGEAGPNSGSFTSRIDGEAATHHAPAALFKNGHGRWFEALGRDLDPNATHTIEITPDLAPDQELRIESLCIAGLGARIEGVSRALDRSNEEARKPVSCFPAI